MVVLYTTTEQTVQPGQSVVFQAYRQTGCSEYVPGTPTSQVYLKPNGLFLLDYSGNVGGTTAATAVQLQVTSNSAAIPETLRTSVPAAVGDLNSISAATGVSTTANCCFNLGAESLSVTNTGTTPIVIGVGFALRIGRVG